VLRPRADRRRRARPARRTSFFITFLSTAEGVKLSPRLLAQYPEEMTIISASISSGIWWDRGSFRGRPVVRRHPERLVVPFASVKRLGGSDCIFPTAVRAFGRKSPMQRRPKIPAVPAPSALARHGTGACRRKARTSRRRQVRRGSGAAGSFPQEII